MLLQRTYSSVIIVLHSSGVYYNRLLLLSGGHSHFLCLNSQIITSLNQNFNPEENAAFSRCHIGIYAAGGCFLTSSCVFLSNLQSALSNGNVSSTWREKDKVWMFEWFRSWWNSVMLQPFGLIHFWINHVCEQRQKIFATVLNWSLSGVKFLNVTGKIVLTDLCSRD